MSTFAVDGLASGLDTTTIVNQLMQLEQQPQARLQKQLSTQTSVINDYQSISTRLRALDTATKALSGDAAWTTRTVPIAPPRIRSSRLRCRTSRRPPGSARPSRRGYRVRVAGPARPRRRRAVAG